MLKDRRGQVKQATQGQDRPEIRENEPSDTKRTVTMNMVRTVLPRLTGLEKGLAMSPQKTVSQTRMRTQRS